MRLYISRAARWARDDRFCVRPSTSWMASSSWSRRPYSVRARAWSLRMSTVLHIKVPQLHQFVLRADHAFEQVEAALHGARAVGPAVIDVVVAGRARPGAEDVGRLHAHATDADHAHVGEHR